MKDFKIRPERRPVVVLLLTSLCLTIGRGITLPFMTIYLNQQYGMAVANVGLAMTFALTAGVLFSGLIVAIFAAWWLTVKGLNVSDAAHAGTVS